MRGKLAKRDTQLIIISVLLLTLITLSVSYSAFFAVKSQSTVQKITTGNLSVYINTASSSQMSMTEILPTATSSLPTSATSARSGSYAAITLANNGTLKSQFSATVSYDNAPSGSSLISFEYLKIGIFDNSTNRWVSFGTNKYYETISNLQSNGVYPILNDTINATTSKRYDVYIWLSEDTPVSEIGKAVYLKIDVKAKTENGNI